MPRRRDPTAPRRPPGRPRKPEGTVFRIQGTRFDPATLSRLDRVLLHVFARLDPPQGARSELVRLAVRYGVEEIEYRLSRGLSADDTPADPIEDSPERCSVATVRRAFRLAGGAADEPERRRVVQLERLRAARRATRAVAAPRPR